MDATEAVLVLVVSAVLAWLLFESGDRYLAYRKPTEHDLRKLRSRSALLFLSARYCRALKLVAWAMAVTGFMTVDARYPFAGVAIVLASVAVWMWRVSWHIRPRLSK